MRILIPNIDFDLFVKTMNGSEEERMEIMDKDNKTQSTNDTTNRSTTFGKHQGR